MTYIPQKKTKKALVFQLILFIGAAAFAVPAASEVPYKWVFQLGFVACFIFLIRNVVRYFMYEYKYIITDKSFVVVQTCGRKEESVCNLALCNSVALLTKEEFVKSKKKIGHIKVSYDYAQNFMSDEKVYYIFEFNHSVSCVAFEADEAFFQEFIRLASFCAETDISSWQE